MIQNWGVSKNFRRNLTASLLAIASCGAGAAPAMAQSSSVATSTQTVNFDIAKGDLGESLKKLGHQANVQIAFLPDPVRGRKAERLRGRFTVEEALGRLLSGTGLRFEKVSARGYVVGGPTKESFDKAKQLSRDLSASQGYGADGKVDVPEILVVGRRWTLNTDIPRTEDDAQPYVVFQREEIQRSGAASLEDFFRNRLGANTTGTLSTNVRTTNGQSQINLRGLGVGATLILVDGRPFAQFNDRIGEFTQSSINGISLDSIERIEVLASSASGIYGANAVGGVINIIMRRDYNGIEANIYYGDTTRFEAGEYRLSLGGSIPLEGGKTRISFNANYSKSGALYLGDRDFVERGRAFASANDPNYVNTLGLIQADYPNITSKEGNLLQLKPEYGGQTLSSAFVAVPVGYRGLSVDGIAPLLATVGQQNLGQAPGTAASGKLTSIISPTKSFGGQVSIRRDFGSWMNFYGELAYSQYENPALADRVPSTVEIPSTAVNNPFTTSILVSMPQLSGRTRVTNRSQNLRGVAGVIVNLPADWKAFADYNYSENRFNASRNPPGLDNATTTGIATGTIDVLRDPYLFPIDFSVLDPSFGSFAAPSRSKVESYSLKLAGPLPFRLWGGKPIATVLAQRSKQSMGDGVNYQNNIDNSSIRYSPSRSNTNKSAYGEVRFPIIGKDNHVPLIDSLELQVAGRLDHYLGRSPTIDGTTQSTDIECLTKVGPLAPEDLEDACPPVGIDLVYNTTSRSSFTPTFALRWGVTPDITFRASYSRGFQPPFLTRLAQVPGPGAIENLGPLAANFPDYAHLLGGSLLVTNVKDPERGGELVGTPVSPLPGLFPPILNLVKGVIGGNPNVEPQTSKSYSAGVILTPSFLPGFRFSADWTKINQRNLYFDPFTLVASGNTPAGQAAFEAYLAAHPERFHRAAPAAGDPFGVGPIDFIDASTANMFRGTSESLDFNGSYETKLGAGRLLFDGSGTILLNLDRQLAPDAPRVNYTGVSDGQFEALLGGIGGVKFKGNGSITYAADRWSLGTRGTYFSGYWLNSDHTVVTVQGSARIPSQVYFDLYGSLKLFDRTEIRFGVNNVFDRKPPIVAAKITYYSTFGDPRLRNFYVNLKQTF